MQSETYFSLFVIITRFFESPNRIINPNQIINPDLIRKKFSYGQHTSFILSDRAQLKKNFIKEYFILVNMADDRIRMPSSGAGLTSFYEESKSKILLSPEVVLGLSILVIIITIVLNVMN